MLRVLGLRVAVGMLLVSFAYSSGAAQGMPEDAARSIFNREWTAISTTAMGITGDARLTPTSITFDGRVTFKLRYLAEITPAHPELYGRGPRIHSLFEFVDPQPREIAHGNHLCGLPEYGPVPLPRYLAVAIEHTRLNDELSIIVYASESLQVALTDPLDCGGFLYAADR